MKYYVYINGLITSSSAVLTAAASSLPRPPYHHHHRSNNLLPFIPVPSSYYSHQHLLDAVNLYEECFIVKYFTFMPTKHPRVYFYIYQYTTILKTVTGDNWISIPELVSAKINQCWWIVVMNSKFQKINNVWIRKESSIFMNTGFNFMSDRGNGHPLEIGMNLFHDHRKGGYIRAQKRASKM